MSFKYVISTLLSWNSTLTLSENIPIPEVKKLICLLINETLVFPISSLSESSGSSISIEMNPFE